MKVCNSVADLDAVNLSNYFNCYKFIRRMTKLAGSKCWKMQEFYQKFQHCWLCNASV